MGAVPMVLCAGAISLMHCPDCDDLDQQGLQPHVGALRESVCYASRGRSNAGP